MIRKQSLLNFTALAGLLLGAIGQSHAAFIPVLEGGAPTFSAGVYTYTYDVLLSADSKVDTSKLPAFITFYDFRGYVAGSAQILSSTAGTSSWNATEQTFGKNGFGTGPTDTSATNISFNYTSATVYTGIKNPFVVVSLQSAYNVYANAPDTEYSGQTTSSSDDTNQGNIGLVLGPNTPVPPPTNTPEPGTVAMLVSSTFGGLLMLRKRRV